MQRALSFDLQLHVCNFVDMESLLHLRSCSRQLQQLSIRAFMDDLRLILNSFLPHPSEFLQALRSTHAFVGGEGATSFLLRLTTPLPRILEVYVPTHTYLQFIHHLFFVQGATRVPCLLFKNLPPFWVPLHGLEDVIRIRTTRGDMYVYRSGSEDALLPICRAPLTPYISFVGPDYFGTPFPSLLFQRRGLLGDGSGDDSDDTEHLLRVGFDICITARAWPEYDVNVCPAHASVCTAQARMFTDRASLTCRVCPLATKRLKSSVVFRLDVKPCGGPCFVGGGGILQEWQLFRCA